ncbi:glycosyltransferase family 39 protein [Chryseobacterium sp. Leaf180]|uniref:glycosyltransferase family 39 protein n=1 Tax=Chryseobacterium sp. Leaf180 TaxID=1736289 RepID=UPI0012FEAAF9|nr:glycosyltransferase family 39 protein [Chryseobacterium sp. Leaf180]
MATKRFILSSILLIYLSVMSFYLFTHQYYNFDIEAYMGLAYQSSNPEMDINTVHSKVYTELRAKNPGHFEYDLVREEIADGENTYYKMLAENPKIYEEELEFFKVKPFYNFVNSFFYKLGFSASTSTFLISIVSYVLVVVLIFGFLLKYLKNDILAFTFTLLLSIFKPMLDSGRHASPDFLAVLLLLACFYFFLSRKYLSSAIISALCILTRPDYFILFTILFLTVLLFSDKLKVKKINALFVFLPALASFIYIQFINKISWSVLFMNQFTKVQLYPVSNPDTFDINDYFSFIRSNILLEFNASYFLLLALFALVIIYNKVKFDLRNIHFMYVLIAAIFFSVFIRFLMFPSLVNRMMLGYYLLIILSSVYNQFCFKEENKNYLK